MNTALEYSTRVVQEGGHQCKKSTLNDLVHLTPLRIPLMNPLIVIGRHFGSWHVCSSRYLSVVEGIVFLSVLGFSVQIYGLQLSEVHY
jgi:hypothetical protein